METRQSRFAVVGNVHRMAVQDEQHLQRRTDEWLMCVLLSGVLTQTVHPYVMPWVEKGLRKP